MWPLLTPAGQGGQGEGHSPQQCSCGCWLHLLQPCDQKPKCEDLLEQKPGSSPLSCDHRLQKQLQGINGAQMRVWHYLRADPAHSRATPQSDCPVNGKSVVPLSPMKKYTGIPLGGILQNRALCPNAWVGAGTSEPSHTPFSPSASTLVQGRRRANRSVGHAPVLHSGLCGMQRACKGEVAGVPWGTG